MPLIAWCVSDYLLLCVPALRSTNDPVSAGIGRKLDGVASVCFAIFTSLWVRHAGSRATCGL